MNNIRFVIVCILMIYTPSTFAGGISQNENQIIISNQYVTITINSNGTVDAITHRGKQYLNSSAQYFSQIYTNYNYKTPINASSIALLADNILEIRYLDNTARIHVKVLVHDKYFSFKTIKAIDFPDEIKRVRFFHADYKYKFYTIKMPDDDTLFMDTIPMNTETVTSFNYADTNIRAGFESSQAAVIIAPKRDYYDAIKTMIADYGLPDSRMDGVWFRESPVPDESYLFAELSKSNYKRILNYAKRMKVNTVLLISPLLFGHYNQPRNTSLFSTLEEFYAACDKFIDAGLKLGIHSHFNRVSVKDTFFENPDRNLLKYEIGTLQSRINNSTRKLTLKKNPGFLPEFKLYARNSKSILVGNEVIEFSAHKGSDILLTKRGHHSRSSAHDEGEKVYILPYDLGSYFLNTEDQEVVKEYTDSLGAVIDRLKISYLYYDGHPFPAITETNSRRGDDWVNLNIKNGVIPLVNRIGTNGIRYQFGETNGQFDFYLSSRFASWDGVEYGNKAFTKQHKVPIVSSNRKIQREFGWWKIHGSKITLNSKSWDTDAVTPDDLHYIMLKAFALKKGVGTQLASRYQWHAKLKQLFDTIGMYNDFIELDQRQPRISESYRKYLARPEVEAELQKHGTEYKFVEKNVHKQYAHWTTDAPYKFNFINSIGQDNHAKIIIYPRFDYFSFEDKQHDILEDFSDVSDWNVSTNNSQVSCKIEKGGVITLHNSGGVGNWCMLRKRFQTTLNLSGKRGLGLSIEGNSGDELFIVKISGNAPGFFNQYGQRDYKFNLDFTGKRNLILANPVSEMHDLVGMKAVKFPISTALRFWTFDYSKVDTATIYIANIKKGAPYQIMLNELKALKEKGDSRLVNPTISVNSRSISFPETLSIKQGFPYMIEYDGDTGIYQVLDSDYNLLSKGNRRPVTLQNGRNIITVDSDLSSNMNSSRAMIDISVYADTYRKVGTRPISNIIDADNSKQSFFPIMYRTLLK